MTPKIQIAIFFFALLALCASPLAPHSAIAASSVITEENRLIDLSSSGVKGVLSYNAKTGQASIITILNEGSGAKQAWQGDLGPNWTNFVPLNHNQRAYVFIYDSTTGNAQYFTLATDGSGMTILHSVVWSSHWNILQHFKKDGNDYLFQYNKNTGYTKIGPVDPTNMKTQPLYSEAWKNDRTAILPMAVNENLYLFLFNQNNGKCVISKLGPINKQLSTEALWWGFWSQEQSEFTTFEYQDVTYLSRYKPQANTLQIMHYSEAKKELISDGNKWLGNLHGVGTTVAIEGTPYWVALNKNTITIYRFEPTLKTMSETWNGPVASQ